MIQFLKTIFYSDMKKNYIWKKLDIYTLFKSLNKEERNSLKSTFNELLNHWCNINIHYGYT